MYSSSFFHIGAKVNTINKDAATNKKLCLIPYLILPSENFPIINPAKTPCINIKLKKILLKSTVLYDFLTIQGNRKE